MSLGDPSLALRMTRIWVFERGKKWRFANYFLILTVFRRIATFFPLYDPEKHCHPERQRRISGIQQELSIRSFDSEDINNTTDSMYL
jgi:hypothetical protein